MREYYYWDEIFYVYVKKCMLEIFNGLVCVLVDNVQEKVLINFEVFNLNYQVEESGIEI